MGVLIKHDTPIEICKHLVEVMQRKVRWKWDKAIGYFCLTLCCFRSFFKKLGRYQELCSPAKGGMQWFWLVDFGFYWDCRAKTRDWMCEPKC